MVKRPWWAIACGILAGAPACRTDAAQWDQACTTSANARCAARNVCSQGYDVTALFGSGGMSACVAANVALCKVNNPGLGDVTKPSDLLTCARQISAQSCDDFLSNLPAPACALPGTVDDGGGCGNNRQCASGFCAIALGDPCGVCAKMPAAGDSCAATATCGPQPLTCSASSGTCVALGDVGAACDPAAPCRPMLGCVGPTGSATCQPTQTTVGAACDPNGETLPACNATVAGLTCDANRTCRPQVQAALGAPCGRLDGPQVTGCVPGAQGSACQSSVCTPRIPEGGACTPGAGSQVPVCAYGTRCILTAQNGASEGICAYPDPNACAESG